MKGDVTIIIFGYSTYVTQLTGVKGSTDSRITALQLFIVSDRWSYIEIVCNYHGIQFFVLSTSNEKVHQ